jgi:hypothetical protein
MMKFILRPLSLTLENLCENQECSPEEILGMGMNMLKEKTPLMHLGRFRPLNAPALRMEKLNELCSQTSFLDLVSDASLHYARKTSFPVSLICRISQTLKEAGFSAAYSCLLWVNSLFPVMLASFPDWRESIVRLFLEMEGVEDNFKIRFVQRAFGAAAFEGPASEAEQQGMIGLFDKHCKNGCKSCPFLKESGIRTFEECQIVEYEPF